MNPLIYIEAGTKRVVVDIQPKCDTHGQTHAIAYMNDSARDSDIRYRLLGRYTTLDEVNLAELMTLREIDPISDMNDEWDKVWTTPHDGLCYPKYEYLERIRLIAQFLDEDGYCGYSDIPNLSAILDYFDMTDKQPEWDIEHESPTGDEVDEMNERWERDRNIIPCESDNWGDPVKLGLL